MKIRSAATALLVATLATGGLTAGGLGAAQAAPDQPHKSSKPNAKGFGNPAGNDTYSVVREAAAGLKTFTVYRPADLTQFRDETLPVVVWGNGGCDRSNIVVSGYLQQVAAAGYVVVADGGVDQATDTADSKPDTLVRAIDWALKSKRALRQLDGKVDPDKVATMGRSCGGLQALRAGLDRRVGAVLALHSGYFAEPRLGFDIAELDRMKAPTLWANGGPDDVAYESSRANYERSGVRSALVEYAVGGHFGVTSGVDITTGEIESDHFATGVEVAVSWLDWNLNNSKKAKKFFTGDNCGLCDLESWTVSAKNLGK